MYSADNLQVYLRYMKVLRFAILGYMLIWVSQNSRVNTNLHKAILPFSIWIFLVTAAFGSNYAATLSRSIAFYLVAIVLFKGFLQIYIPYPKKFTLIYLGVILFFIGVPLLLRYTPFGPNLYVEGRFSGFMGNPNGLGVLSFFCIPLFDLLAKRHLGDWNKNAIRLIYLILIVSVVMSGSRNALICLVVYELAKLSFKNMLGVVLFMFALVSLYLFYQYINIVDIIIQLGLEEYFRVDTLEDGSGRADVWEVVWAECQNHFYMGKGMLYDQFFLEDYRRIHFSGDVVMERVWNGTWNSYLSLIMDSGIIGVALYFYACVKWLQSSIDRVRGGAFLLAALMSAITESWMVASMNAFTPMFFLYWAIASVNPNELKKSENTNTIH